LNNALDDYDVLKSGPDPDKVRLAEARLENAQTQLAVAQALWDRATMNAPFAGTVSKVNTNNGEWVVAGQAILVLADLNHLRVETTDLSERDIPQVEIGQPVMVFIEALNETVTGKVTKISPLAETLGGDVVYQTTIELDTLPPGLRAGMSVEVQIQSG
jgi:multidrug resistance efflux pump